MLPLVPSSLLNKKASFTNHFQVIIKDGRKSYFIKSGHARCEMALEMNAEGFLDEGLLLPITFSHCRLNVKGTVHLKSLSVVFGPLNPGGPTVMKKIEETVVDHKNNSIDVSLTKEEVLLLSPPDGQVGKIPFEVQICVENAYGNRYLRTLTFNFYERNSESTLALMFAGGKKMYVNVTLLSIHSQYFKTLSEHSDDLTKDEKSDLPLLKLEEYDSDVFENILKLIYPNVEEDPFSRKDIVKTLRLADFLSFETVLYQYEKLLSKDSENHLESPCQKLLLSLEYGMTQLQFSVIKQLKTVKAVQKLRNDPRFNDLPKEIISQVLAKLLDMVGDNRTPVDEEFDIDW